MGSFECRIQCSGFIKCQEFLYYYQSVTAIGLTPGGSSTVHIYTPTVHREQNIRNNYKELNQLQEKNWEVRALPCLCELHPGIWLTTEEKYGKPSVRVVEKCPDIPVAAVQYTFTHKQYTEQHNDTERSIHD
jgi:hypothetical protein